MIFSVENVEKRLLVALLICTILSVIFIGIALAATDEDEDYTSNLKGWAYAKGWYTEAPGHYYKTYHKGQVSIGAGPMSWTKFRGVGGTSPYGWTHTDLDPGEYDELTMDPANVVVAETKTYPGQGEDIASAYIAVGLG